MRGDLLADGLLDIFWICQAYLAGQKPMERHT
jgi:hypothetical protein